METEERQRRKLIEPAKPVREHAITIDGKIQTWLTLVTPNMANSSMCMLRIYLALLNVRLQILSPYMATVISRQQRHV